MSVNATRLVPPTKLGMPGMAVAQRELEIGRQLSLLTRFKYKFLKRGKIGNLAKENTKTTG